MGFVKIRISSFTVHHCTSEQMQCIVYFIFRRNLERHRAAADKYNCVIFVLGANILNDRILDIFKMSSKIQKLFM